MIDFNTSQLTWIVVGALGMGGTGYVSINDKIDTLTTKVSVSNANMDHTVKSLDQLQKQMERIENKIDNEKR
jgi:outer membrane murein-binding lipoprotein Lpp